MQGTIRSVLAGIVGVVVALATVTIGEGIGHAIYPPPPNLDFSNQAALREFVAGLPIGALLFVVGSWIAATIAGGAVAGAIACPRAMTLALVVGGVILAASIVNLALIPHPAWFAVVALAGIPLAAWMTGRTLRES